MLLKKDFLSNVSLNINLHPLPPKYDGKVLFDRSSADPLQGLLGLYMERMKSAGPVCNLEDMYEPTRDKIHLL